MTGHREARIILAHSREMQLFSRSHLDQLSDIGTLLSTDPINDWNAPGARRLLEKCTVICGHWGCPPIDRRVLESAPELALVAYAAGSVKGVLGQEVWDRGVCVTSGAAANAEPVAEFTLAAILFAGKAALWRTLPESPQSRLAVMGIGHQVGNYDKTIGIVGASRVGRRVIELLDSFPHLHVVVSDPYLTEDSAISLGVKRVSLDELCRTSDVVSLHAPAIPSTVQMIGMHQLGLMAEGTTLINTARGSLVDHEALAVHLRDGRLRAILDVTDPEPLPADHELLKLPLAFVTPHLAGSQGAELRRLADCAVDEVRRWAEGRPAIHELRADDMGISA